MGRAAMTRYEKKQARRATVLGWQQVNQDEARVARALSTFHREEGYHGHKWAVSSQSVAPVPQRPGSRSRRHKVITSS